MSSSRVLPAAFMPMLETLPGPFEYDVKRMAASFTIAARNNGFSSADTRDVTMASVTAYREAIASFAQMRTMDIWYAHLDEDELMKAVRGVLAETAQEAKKGPKGARKQAKQKAKAARKAEKDADKARTRDRPAGAVDRSVTDFSQRYADQNERDYQEFVKAIRSGRLEAREGV